MNPLKTPRPAALALADGTVFRGTAFGATAVATGVDEMLSLT